MAFGRYGYHQKEVISRKQVAVLIIVLFHLIHVQNEHELYLEILSQGQKLKIVNPQKQIKSLLCFKKSGVYIISISSGFSSI